MRSGTTRVVAAGVWLTLGASCGGDDDGFEPDSGHEPVYENVEAVVLRSCAFSATCHGGAGDGQANLNFARPIQMGEPFTAALTIDRGPKPSCEYSAMPLLTPGDPAQSWFYIKLTNPTANERLQFSPDPLWDPGITRGSSGGFPASECPLTEDGEIVFGRLMPWTNGAPAALPMGELELIREWIALGAEGPLGG